MRIVPGGDTLPQTSPLGEFTDVQRFASRVSNWDSNGDGLLFAEESQGDLALLGLSTRIGDVTGWLPLDAQRSSFSAQLLGYPSRGTGLMSATSFAQPDANTSNLIVGLGLGEGASGGPIVHTIDGEAHVAGTLSSGDGGLTTSRYAALFGNANLPWLQAAIAANDDLITARTTLRLQGGSDNDTLAGNPANDVLFGGGGRDCITGSGGSDLIDGGTGVDTVWLRGPRGDYGLSETTGAINPPAGLSAQAAFTLRLTDTAPGRDGTLDLSRVERLQFSDLAMALDVRGEAGDAVSIVGAVLAGRCAKPLLQRYRTGLAGSRQQPAVSGPAGTGCGAGPSSQHRCGAGPAVPELCRTTRRCHHTGRVEAPAGRRHVHTRQPDGGRVTAAAASGARRACRSAGHRLRGLCCMSLAGCARMPFSLTTTCCHGPEKATDQPAAPAQPPEAPQDHTQVLMEMLRKHAQFHTPAPVPVPSSDQPKK